MVVWYVVCARVSERESARAREREERREGWMERESARARARMHVLQEFIKIFIGDLT